MTLTINNSPYETNATTLTQLAEERKIPNTGVALAVNNTMVPRTQWAEHKLQEGQNIIILKAFSGG